MRYASVVAGTLLSTVLAVPNCEADILWDGSGDPRTGDYETVGNQPIDTPYYQFDTNGYDEFNMPVPSPGFMTQDSKKFENSTYSTHFGLKNSIRNAEMVSANGYVVEWSVNTIYANPDDPFPFEISMQIADDHSGVLLSMFPDSIKYYANSGSSLIDVPTPPYSAGFHTFKVRKAAGKTNFALSIDGGAYLPIPGTTAYTNFFEFGDSSSGSAPSNGIAVWDYISITSPSPSIPGDYNSDTVVDALDYDAWRATFGSPVELDADGDGNFEIDAADYVVWRKFLGTESSAASVSAVPEPSGALMLMIAAAIGSIRRRRSAFDCVVSAR